MLNVSYKPQKISPKAQGTVRQLLHEKIRDAYIHPQFVTDVIKPLQIEQLFDQEVKSVTLNELRRDAGLEITHTKKNTFPLEMLQKYLPFCPNFSLSDRKS